MKTLFPLLLLALPSFATTYFVSAAGNDSNSGTSTGSPWLTVSKVQSTTLAGDDVVSFRCGDQWREMLTVQQSGSSGHPITFTKYGTCTGANNPIFDGSNVLSATWTQYSASLSFSTARTYAASTQFTDSLTRNYRCIIKANTLAGGGAVVRVTFKASSTTNANITGASMCLMTTAPTCDTTPTRLTFASGSNGATVTAGGTTLSDNLTFTIDTTKQYAVGIYTTARNFKVDTATSNIDYYAGTTASDESQNTTITSPATVANQLVAVSLIEVSPAAGATNAWFTALGADPVVIFDNQVALPVQSSIANVVATAGSEVYTGGSAYIHLSDNSNPNTNGRLLENATRSNTIDGNAKNWLIIDGIDQRKSSSGGLGVGGLAVSGADSIVRNLSSYSHYNHALTFYLATSKRNLATNVSLYNSYSARVVSFYGAGTVGGNTGNILKNCIIYNTLDFNSGGANDIDMHGAATANTVQNCNLYDSTDTIYGTIHFFDANTTGNFVLNNYIHGTGSSGVMCDTGANTQTITGNYIDQSLFPNTGTNGSFYANACTGNLFAHNTVTGDNGRANVIFNGAATSNTQNNNIATSILKFYRNTDSSFETGFASDYNNVFNFSSGFGDWAGTLETTLANWQAASSKDAHSLGISSRLAIGGGDLYRPMALEPRLWKAGSDGLDIGADFSMVLHIPPAMTIQ